ncbi:MAG: B12-binding domain-containing radical SAM protein [Candidatus Marinimicrobia bacterium CG08_land_8_20_14_0_20_45_22]|nr:MAG: B12-binding domain-containing radical SAM protein [Candidatus Marinimicrobia bacterium CG08_land_8_20_14_0_20_45_22]
MPIKNERLIDNFLFEVEKPGRYAGGEFGTQIKDRSKPLAEIALAYPDLYDVGMSYYGFQILYHILNRDEEITAERVYAPWPDFEEKLRKHSVPLFSLESRTPLKYFDVIGFTLPYELTATNILNMLDLAEIPVYAQDRNESDPIIIGGGCGAYSPEPLAPFFDGFVVGDGEEIVVPLTKEIYSLKRQNVPRNEILLRLPARFPGLYIPSLYDVDLQTGKVVPKANMTTAPKIIRALRVRELTNDFYPEVPIMPLVETSQDRLVVEIMRGCTQGCRFCQAGMINRPVRERHPDDVLKQIENSFVATGYDDVSLFSLSSSDYAGLDQLADGIVAHRVNHRHSVSFPSLRLDSFRENIAQLASQTRKSGLTFAPEAGSQRLRNVINKDITEEELLSSTEIAVRNGWRVIKLYFMLGLPTETYEDLADIADLTRKVIQVGNGRLNINVTLSTFIPKPFTPFQWSAQDSPETIQRKLDFIKPRLLMMRQVKVMARNPQFSRLEGVIARGDRRIADVIYRAWKNGAKFDSWREYFSAELWESAFIESNLEPAKFTSDRSLDEPLAWDHIDSLVTKNYLISEFNRSLKGKTTPDCRTHCYGCGVCQPSGLQMMLVTPSADEPHQPIALPPDDEPIGSPVKFRLKYRKSNVVRFTSHLDVLRIFQQAMRRADLDLIYTEGFNQRPKISAGFPLPLGYTSDEEFLDVTLKSETIDLVKRLNAELAGRFEIVSAERLAINAKSAFSDTAGFLYEILFPAEINPVVEKNVRDLLEKKEYIIQRAGEKATTQIDIRQFLKTIQTEAGILKVEVQIINGRTVKIRELLPILGLENASCSVSRKKTYLTTNHLQNG